MQFTHLNTKSHYSLLNSILKVEDIINHSINNGFLAVSLCDVNTTFGLHELYFKAGDIKPLLGVELSFDSDSYILYAKNYQGLQNIYYLTSLVNKGELTREIFFEYSNNLICILNAKSRAYVDYYNNSDSNLLEQLQLTFGNLYFISTFQNEDLISFCKTFNLKMLFGHEVKYGMYSDKKYYDLLLAIKNGENYIRDNSGERTYFYTNEEVRQNVSKEILMNTKEIITSCDVVIPSEVLIPVYSKEHDSKQLLYALCKRGMSKRFVKIEERYIERLKYELDVICSMGFADYFLIVYDYIKYAKNNDILVGAGRGSAASSLVSYVLGITEIDPLKYNLLFERFLNPERISWPDIDIDFEDERRDEVVEYVRNKYGDEYVGAISTFSTFASKQVIRDSAKAFGKNSVEIKYLTEHINPMISLKANYKQNDDFKMKIDEDVSNERIYQYALKLEGLVRHNSIHAAGVVVSNQVLDKTVGILPSEKIKPICATMDYIENMGLIKMDFLGLRNLTLLKSILKMVEEQHSEKIDIYKINFEDEKVLSLFAAANTTGIFQFESAGMRNLLRKLKPQKFLDLASANALHRPGPMDNIDEFVERAHGKRFTYIHDNLEEILSQTYGIIVYQEQIMEIARVVASFSYAKADILRSAMSKKNMEKLANQKSEFIASGVANGYELEIVEEIFESILKFANYGFNKAHAVSYSVIGYILGYLKCYYPNIFIVSLMNNSIASSKKIFDYINECRVQNIEITGLDINRSLEEFYIDDNKIVMPLLLVKGINRAIANEIVTERKNGAFKSFRDFVVRMSELKPTIIENLVYANAFENLNEKESKKSLVFATPKIIDIKQSSLGQTLFQEEFYYTKIEEYTTTELVKLEKDVLGFNFSLHPTSLYINKMQVNTLNLNEYLNKRVQMVLYVESIKTIKTKRGDDMAFVKCSDIYGMVEAVCFPRVLKKSTIASGDLIYVYGKIDKRNDKYQLVIDNFKVRSE